MTETSKPNKQVEIRFRGGCKDGQVLRTDSPSQNDRKQAHFFNLQSKRIGYAFYVTSDAAWNDLTNAKKTVHDDGTMTVEGLTVPQGPRHKYRLAECTDNERERILTFSFDGLRPEPDESQ